MKKNNIILLLAIFIVAITSLVFSIVNTNNQAKIMDYLGMNEVSEYDVSDLNTIDASKFLELVNQDKYSVIYLGRETCGYCVKFLPIMLEAQENMEFTTNYIDIENVDNTTEDYSKMVELIDAEADNYNKAFDLEGENAYTTLFGVTPLVVVVGNGKIQNVWLGYGELETYTTWLNDSLK